MKVPTEIQTKLKDYLALKKEQDKIKKKLDTAKDDLRRLTPSNCTTKVGRYSIYWACTQSTTISLTKARAVLTPELFKKVVNHGSKNTFTVKPTAKKRVNE